jgi:hypothetical protein
MCQYPEGQKCFIPHRHLFAGVLSVSAVRVVYIDGDWSSLMFKREKKKMERRIQYIIKVLNFNNECSCSSADKLKISPNPNINEICPTIIIQNK